LYHYKIISQNQYFCLYHNITKLIFLSLLNFCYLQIFVITKKLFLKYSQFLKKFTYIRINDIYDPYGLLIRMNHTDCQSVWIIQIVDLYVHIIFFLLTSPFPMIKIDQNSPYTPHKRTYTTEDQIRFQTNLNRSNLH